MKCQCDAAPGERMRRRPRARTGSRPRTVAPDPTGVSQAGPGWAGLSSSSGASPGVRRLPRRRRQACRSRTGARVDPVRLHRMRRAQHLPHELPGDDRGHGRNAGRDLVRELRSRGSGRLRHCPAKPSSAAKRGRSCRRNCVSCARTGIAGRPGGVVLGIRGYLYVHSGTTLWRNEGVPATLAPASAGPAAASPRVVAMQGRVPADCQSRVTQVTQRGGPGRRPTRR